MSLTQAQKDSIIAKDPRYAAVFAGTSPLMSGPSPLAPPTSPSAQVVGTPDPRPRKCIHLGVITERKSSCWKLCYHICNLGHPPTRPGVECQTCSPDDYEPE